MPSSTNRPPQRKGTRWRGRFVYPRLPSNGDLPSNYGRTSPPAKTILACEPINLCLWLRLPSNGDLPSNYGRTIPPAKTIIACEPINPCLF